MGGGREGRKKGKKEGWEEEEKERGERRGTRLNPFLKNQKLPYLRNRLQQDIPLRGRYEKERIRALYKFAIIDPPTSGSANSSHKQH